MSVDRGELDLPSLYSNRFAGDAEFRNRMWQVLCQRFFQTYVDRASTVLEIGAGHCEFINHIDARRRIAVDLSRDCAKHAAPGVEVVTASSTDLSSLPDGTVDVVFASNFFEHLSRPDIVSTLREARRVLVPNGRMLILQPNVRFCYRDYWMFFDHITPLDDRSLVEALEMTGFRKEQVIVRFLPFTTKSRLPKSILLLKLYLSFPLIWRILGAQSFLAARKA